MKPILIFGASISAVAVAAGFAVLADQAIPRRAADADPIRPATVARDAPELTAIIRREAPKLTPKLAAPAAAEIAPALATSTRAVRPQMSLLPAPAAGQGLALRPLPRPARLAAGLDLAQAGEAPLDLRQAPIAARFDYIPLSGVYR